MQYLFAFIFISQLLFFGSIDRIQKAYEKQEYEKALDLIDKGLEKEPTNPGLSYYKALIYGDSLFIGYDQDAARIFTEQALAHFDSISTDLEEDLLKDGVTKAKVEKLYARLRDRQFQETIKDVSLVKIARFEEYFPNSLYQEVLEFKRDSIEFQTARNTSTENALVTFIATHPASVYTPVADSLLDQMRWIELEKRGTLEDYYQFLDRHPYTRYRPSIETYIFHVSTVTHHPDNYVDFIRFAQTVRLRKQAADVLLFLDPELGIRYHPNADSATIATKLASTRLIPIATETGIGFSDQSGHMQIRPQFFSAISEGYKCASTQDTWIFVKKETGGMIITKQGVPILKHVDGYTSIYPDIGLVEKNDQSYLYHKSGYKILDQPIDEAEVLDGKWIKIKRDGKKGLVSYTGYNIAEIIYDDIYQSGSFWIFEKDGLLAVYREDLIKKEIEDRGITLEFKFDDIELINRNALIGFREDRECLLDSSLQFLIPWGNYEIYPDKSGWYLRSGQGYRLYNATEQGLMDRYFPYLEANDGWLTLKTATDWMLIPRQGSMQPSREYDSVKLLNNHAAIVEKSPEKNLLFTSGSSVGLLDQVVTVLPSRPDYVSISDQRSTVIYNEKGESVIKGRFENTYFINDTLVRVQVRGKQGLMHVSGKWILNPVFDTIDEKDGLVLTLIKGKIGCYDPAINELIETGYEERLTRFGPHYLARKNDKFGVVNYESEVMISFDYDEIMQWNDSSLLVKKGRFYSIINEREEEIGEPLESLKLILKNNLHSVYRFIEDGKYGLVSTQFGQLIPPDYSDIFNIGTEREPLFFADQHLAKAGFHVVSYVNQKGDLVLSRAYTRSAFNQILCDD